MSLTRGKKMTTTPSGSNIRVNKPDFGTVFNSAITVLDEKAQIDERREELEFRRNSINWERDKVYNQAEIKSASNTQKNILDTEEANQKLFEDDMKAHADYMEKRAKAKADRIEAIHEINSMKFSNALQKDITNFKKNSKVFFKLQ